MTKQPITIYFFYQQKKLSPLRRDAVVRQKEEDPDAKLWWTKWPDENYPQYIEDHENVYQEGWGVEVRWDCSAANEECQFWSVDDYTGGYTCCCFLYLFYL